jgi:hypothetical protein
MALVMAMIVVVLITMLVAGAISFTGTELAAAEVQTQEAAMSACIQAARNLFLSKLKRVMQEVPDANGTVFLPINFDEDFLGAELRTGHVGELAALSARRAETLTDKMKGQGDDTDRGKRNSAPAFYTVTAVCRDTTVPFDPARPELSPEREIEFMVRVGI